MKEAVLKNLDKLYNRCIDEIVYSWVVYSKAVTNSDRPERQHELNDEYKSMVDAANLLLQTIERFVEEQPCVHRSIT